MVSTRRTRNSSNTRAAIAAINRGGNHALKKMLGVKPKPKTQTKKNSPDKRIQALEAQVRALKREVKRLSIAVEALRDRPKGAPLVVPKPRTKPQTQRPPWR